VVEIRWQTGPLNLAPDKDLLKLLSDNQRRYRRSSQAVQAGGLAAQAIGKPALRCSCLVGSSSCLRSAPQGRRRQDPAMSFGKSKARVQMEPPDPGHLVGDVAGHWRAPSSNSLRVVDFLKNPDRFTAVWGQDFQRCVCWSSPAPAKLSCQSRRRLRQGFLSSDFRFRVFVEMFVGVGRQPRRVISSRGQENIAPASLHRTKSMLSAAQPRRWFSVW